MAFPVSTRATDFLVTAAVWNADVVANLNELGPIVREYKSADQALITGTTLTDDTDLQFPIGASEVWAAQYHLQVAITAAADYKQNFTVPSGATGTKGGIDAPGASVNATGWRAATITTEHSVAVASDATGYLSLYAVVINSTTPGDVKLQFAQIVDSGAGVTHHVGSFMIAHRLSP